MTKLRYTLRKLAVVAATGTVIAMIAWTPALAGGLLRIALLIMWGLLLIWCAVLDQIVELRYLKSVRDNNYAIILPMAQDPREPHALRFRVHDPSTGKAVVGLVLYVPDDPAASKSAALCAVSPLSWDLQTAYVTNIDVGLIIDQDRSDDESVFLTIDLAPVLPKLTVGQAYEYARHVLRRIDQIGDLEYNDIREHVE